MVVCFNLIVTSIHLHEHGFAQSIGAVVLRTVEGEIVKEDDIAGFALDWRGVFQRVVIEKGARFLSAGVRHAPKFM